MSDIDILNFTFAGIGIGTLSKVALMLIMVSMGLSLKTTDFVVLTERPKPVFVGLIGQVLLLPVVGIVITLLFKLSPEIAMGLIIIAACPGGATSNFMTYLSKGDVALSIVLTALSGLIAVFTLPYVINYGLSLHQFAQAGVQLPVINTIWNIFTLTALPVFIGMLFRHLNPKGAIVAEKLLTPASFAVLIFIMALIAKEVWPNLGAMLRAGVIPVLTLNLVMLLVGIGLGKVTHLTPRVQRTLGIEIGFQNYTLGVVIALVMLKSPEMTIAPIIYLFSMYLTAIFVVLWGRRQNSKERQSELYTVSE